MKLKHAEKTDKAIFFIFQFSTLWKIITVTHLQNIQAIE